MRHTHKNLIPGVLREVGRSTQVLTNSLQVVTVVGGDVDALLDSMPHEGSDNILLKIGKNELTQGQTLHEFGIHPIGMNFREVPVILPFPFVLEPVVFHKMHSASLVDECATQLFSVRFIVPVTTNKTTRLMERVVFNCCGVVISGMNAQRTAARTSDFTAWTSYFFSPNVAHVSQNFLAQRICQRV